MLEIFIKRPAMTIVFILIFMIMGIVSIGNLIIEPMPKIEFPLVTVTTVYPGASPIEIETQIIKKIEDAVSEISQIKSIKSDAKDSVGVVLIEFLIEADVNVKSIEVKDKVEVILNDFPSAADRPNIAKFDPLVQPIAQLTLDSTKLSRRDLFEYADKNLKAKLSSIEGVASVDIFGGRERQINIFLDNNLLIQNYLSIQDVIVSIQRKNLNVPGGAITSKDSKISVRFVGEFEDVKSIEDLEIVSKEGRVYKLKDIARIEDSFKDIESIARANQKEVVGIDVKKLSDGDAVKIVNILKKELKKIEISLPEGTSLDLMIDSTEATISDTENTIKNILLGIGLTVIVLLIFLGDWRGALISAIVIPTSIISTFFLMDMAEFSINFMTLLAFGTSIGTLIANALLIIENSNNHLQNGKKPQDAAIDATKEVLLSVIAGAGTNLVVFTPLAFMGGIVGQFMKQFGMTVVFATIFSIIASVTLTPTLCALLLRDPNKNKGLLKKISNVVDRFLHFLLEEYRFFFNKMMNFPILSIFIGILVFSSIIYPAKRTGFEFIPKSDRNALTVTILMPDGTSIEKTERVVKKVENELYKIKEAKNILSNLGYDGEESAKITLDLIDNSLRNRTTKDLIEYLLPKIALIPEAEITLESTQRSTDNSGDITIDIRGESYEEMSNVSRSMVQIMEDSGYFTSVKNSFRIPKMEIKFKANPQNIIKQDLSNSDIGGVIRALVNGNDDAVYKENGEEYDINVTLANEYKQSIKGFDKFLIKGKDGLLPISKLGKLTYSEASSPLKRRDKDRIIQIQGYLSKGVSGQVMAELTKKFEIADFPKTVNFRYAGKAENMKESGQELGKAFILAVILTYMLLVAILDSFILPVSIASSILTSFLGVFVMMFFLDFTVNIASMMAMVMVVGLAVNNAILMIEYSEQKIREGLHIDNALWEGARLKLKPIIMTSLAIIMGTLPQLFDIDKAKASMGGVVIGGMIGSVIFTYLMVPAVHKLLYKIKGGFSKYFDAAIKIESDEKLNKFNN
ncbi:MAG: HAE1 family hydrophobic/amphiphilic exporter-1 [Bacteriovoracaceae bacterium]|jgi:HAE1 family hydrophobic/amphiphilic exporter-1